MTDKTIRIAAAVPALLLCLVACSSNADGNRVVIKENGATITVVNNAAHKAGDPDVAIEKLDRVDNAEITDWLDEETVIVSKENESLDQMRLEELSGMYPKSLYLYNLNTKQYKLLKEQNNAFLGGAVLSPDKKHLLYHEMDLGDPVYHVMNLETLQSFGLVGEPIGGAVSAHWADKETIIGAAYGNGAYIAYMTGEIGILPGLDEVEGLYIVKKMKDTVYYNTNADGTLRMLNLVTGEQSSLDLDQVYGVFPSPDGNQMLVLQYIGSKTSLILCDATGGNKKTIVEGTDLGGVSWSPDQRMIAYSLKADAAGTTANGLYLYDMLTGETTRIAVDLELATTAWSPSGQALVYTEWKANKPSSSIVHLKYSLQK